MITLIALEEFFSKIFTFFLHNDFKPYVLKENSLSFVKNQLFDRIIIEITPQPFEIKGFTIKLIRQIQIKDNNCVKDFEFINIFLHDANMETALKSLLYILPLLVIEDNKINYDSAREIVTKWLNDKGGQNEN